MHFACCGRRPGWPGYCPRAQPSDRARSRFRPGTGRHRQPALRGSAEPGLSHQGATRTQQVITGKDLGESPAALVPSVVPAVPKDGSGLILKPSFGGVNDLGLSEVVRVWRNLPEHIKQTILTLTRTVKRGRTRTVSLVSYVSAGTSE